MPTTGTPRKKRLTSRRWRVAMPVQRRRGMYELTERPQQRARGPRLLRTKLRLRRRAAATRTATRTATRRAARRTTSDTDSDSSTDSEDERERRVEEARMYVHGRVHAVLPRLLRSKQMTGSV